MNVRLNSTIQRINLIKFNEIKYQDIESHKILAQEFLRRVTLAIHSYSINVIRYPYIRAKDITGEELDLWGLCPKLEEIENGSIKFMCYFSLEWAMLVDMGVPVAKEFEDLYDPILRLFERGGSFSMRQGTFNVGEAAYHIATWRHELIKEPFDISDLYLNQVDLEQDTEVMWENGEVLKINCLENAQKRLCSIDWRCGGIVRKSHEILINEYLQRVAYFKRFFYLNVDSPFLSVVEALGYSNSLEIDTICPTLQSIEHSLVRLAFKDYLELSALVDQKVLRARKYYNLYEPLIKLFERGGRIQLINNDLIVGVRVIPLSDWFYYATTIPSENISNDSLDKLDQG